MKKRTKAYIITNIIAVVLYLLLGLLLYSREKGNSIILILTLPVFGYLTSFILAGIPSLIRKIMKKPTYFMKTFIFGIIMNLLLYFTVILFLSLNFINLTQNTLNIIILIKFIIMVIAVILHAALYNITGFFYLNLLKIIFEKISPMMIITKDDYKNFGIAEKKEIKHEEKKLKAEKEKKDESKKIFKTFLNKLGLLFKSLFGIIKVHKKKIIFSVIGLIIIVILAGGAIFGYKIIESKFIAKIEAFYPTGYTQEKMVIKVLFTSEIDFKDPDNPGEILKINPNIPGSYKIEGQTLIFIPDNDLPLSNRYKVTVNTSLLKAKNKPLIKGGTYTFHTKMMEVRNTSFYFNVNENTKLLDELIGEIEFTLPIDFDSLKERIEVRIDNEVLTISNIEQSARGNIIYLKVKGIVQEDKTRNIEIKIKKGVKPQVGIIPLEEDFTADVRLREKDRLSVESCETYPVVGNTYITIKFNMPVEGKGLKNYITINPSIPFKITSEYRYVVLEANFEPNRTYDVKVSKELKSIYGFDMKQDYGESVTIKDIEPYVKFSVDGKILPMTDNLNIEFVTLNLDEVTLSVEKIYKNNLTSYVRSSQQYEYYDEYEYGYGQSTNYDKKFIHSRNLKIEGGNINEELKNLINLKELFNTKYTGLYSIKLSDTKNYYNYSSMTVNITNIGLIIKNDGQDLTVHAIDIMDLNPISNVKITLVSKENQIVREGYTNSQGRITINDYLLTDESLIPYLILAEKGSDFTFLQLATNHLDFSTFDVSGKSFNKDMLEAYIATERGVYRPGEDVFASVIIRKANLSNPDSLPLVLKVDDPTGKTVFNETFKIDGSGITSVKIPTQYHFKTGVYYATIKQDDVKTIGLTSFKVEEFIPHKIELKIDLLENFTNRIKFKVKSSHLHGAPAKGLRVNCKAVFKSENFINKNYLDYKFYNDNKKDFYQVVKDLGEDKLDENGEKIYDLVIPLDIDPPSAIRAEIYVEVFDDTGRPLGDVLATSMHKYSTYYGVKVDGDGSFSTNKKVNIKYLAIDKDGKKIKMDDVSLKIERKVWYTIFKKFSWTRKYTSETYHEMLYDKNISINGSGEYSFTPDKGGEYTVTIGHKDGMQTTRTIYVYDDQYREYRDLSDPYKLIMNLDKEKYAIGETAYLTIIAPFDGKAIVNFEREKIYDSQYIDLSSGKAVIPIRITEDFLPNMYITAMAFRKPTYELITLPPVSYGAVNIAFDRTKIEQDVKITTSNKIRSSDGLTVNINVNNGAGSKVIIAAVDEGILQLTNYQKPDPYEFFYRKRKLSVMTNTSLKDLLPDIAPYKKAFGGGFEGDVERRHLNPIIAKRVKSMALYSGVLECDSAGNVSHTFKMDQFNGKVRVMVLSAKNKLFGSSQAQVTVSDPIVIMPGVPRILAPNDQAMIPVKIYNKTGKKGKFTVTLKTDGPVSIDGKDNALIDIAKDGDREILFKINAKNDVGIAKIRFDASGNNESSFHEIEFAVRPASPLYTEVKQGDISKGGEAKIILDKQLIKPGTFKQIIISGNNLTRCMGALEYLIRYPYGCTEQTVSAAFPLLYLKELAKDSGLFSQNPYLIDKYINIAIKKVESRVLNDGTVAFWDGMNYGYPWISDYASHFIIEAKRHGYPVTESIYDKLINRIGVNERGRLDRRADVSGTPYILYLRALMGKPDFDTLKYYYDMLNDRKKRDNLTERDRCMLAAAYALAGDKNKGKEFLPGGFVIKTMIRVHFDTFDSYVRNTALYMFALALIDPNDTRINYLEKEIFKSITNQGHFGNTQDTSWSLLALSQLNKYKDEAINAEIYVDGKLYKNITGKTVITTNDLTGKEYMIKNQGTKECYYACVLFGYPLTPDYNEQSKGFKVEKKYYNTNGQPIDIKSVKQGDQIVVTLKVENKTKKDINNVILVDLLPSGFEIENLRLASRGDYPDIEDNVINIVYEDIRDDRIIIAANEISGYIRFSYVVRAVSPGKFIIPQFQAEAMYDPEIFGRTRGGLELIIQKKD